MGFLAFVQAVHCQFPRPVTDIPYDFQADVPYGPDDQMVFDIWSPESEPETPLVIFYHGGGFLKGDKREIRHYQEELIRLLKAGAAVASANYRYRLPNDSLGVTRSLRDAKRCLQYIRYHAVSFNIDPSRIGCFGVSAGGGISLYLAFHDDMAESDAGERLLRESTRIACAAGKNTQASYNLWTWLDFLPGMKIIYFFRKRSMNRDIARFYGYPAYAEFRPVQRMVCESLDMLEMMSPDDPPFWVRNDQKAGGWPKNMNQMQHHPHHARVLAHRAKEAGITGYACSVSTESRESPISWVDFMIAYLKIADVN